MNSATPTTRATGLDREQARRANPTTPPTRFLLGAGCICAFVLLAAWAAVFYAVTLTATGDLPTKLRGSSGLTAGVLLASFGGWVTLFLCWIKGEGFHNYRKLIVTGLALGNAAVCFPLLAFGVYSFVFWPFMAIAIFTGYVLLRSLSTSWLVHMFVVIPALAFVVGAIRNS